MSIGYVEWSKLTGLGDGENQQAYIERITVDDVAYDDTHNDGDLHAGAQVCVRNAGRGIMGNDAEGWWVVCSHDGQHDDIADRTWPTAESARRAAEMACADAIRDHEHDAGLHDADEDY